MTPNIVLQTYWGYTKFREPQKEIIDAVLQKKDVIALLPTGGGKSICYQIPALLLDGITLVVSPLLSLMEDQIQNLSKKGIKALYVKSGSTTDEIITLFDNLKFSNTKLLYLSPERLQSNLILQKLQELNVSLIAVDEAHCISEWGHDFRPSFLQIKKVKALLGSLPTIALTASANQVILKDIQLQLELENPQLFKKSFERKNLAYQLFCIENKKRRLLQIATKMKSPIIVYTNTRKKTEKISKFLQQNGFATTFYHGGLSKKEKDAAFTDWMTEKKRIIVATNAFGMGIDKPNVDVVIHMDLPYSVENYFQEAGRGGRGGQKSFSVMLWNKADVEVFKKQFIKSYPNLKFLKEFTKKLYQHFQIAHGEQPEEVFHFDFLAFCNTYSFATEKSASALQILNNNGVIEITKNFQAKSLLKIIVNPNEVDYHVKSEKKRVLLENSVRSYTGLFSETVKINEFTLAAKMQTTSNKVMKWLGALHKNNIVLYQPYNNLQSLVFLKPREDAYTINSIAKNVLRYLNQKEKKMEALLQFVHSDTCRNQWLLSYFDEVNSKECGICDVCLQKKIVTSSSLTTQILKLLEGKQLSSAEIVSYLKTKEEKVLWALKKLLLKEKIQINFKNQYELYQ